MFDKSKWAKVKLGDVAKESKLSGKFPYGAGFDRLVGLEHLDPSFLKISRWVDITDNTETTFTKLFTKGQVLFGRRRAYQKKASVTAFNGVCSGDITVIESNGKIISALLPFIIQNDALFEYAVSMSNGSLSPRVKWVDLSKYEFLLPPIGEQKQLAELLWAANSVVENWSDIRDYFERTIFPNIIDEALRGDLSAHNSDERSAHLLKLIVNGEGKNKRRKSQGIKPVEIEEQPYEIPENWCYVRLGDIIDFVGGSQPPRSTFVSEYQEGYIRLIQIRDYKNDNYLTYIPIELAKRFCDGSDVMIGRYGPPVFQILRGIKGSYNVALIKAVPLGGISNDYVYCALREKRLYNKIIALSKRTCGQDGVDMDALKNHVIGLPPLEEQGRILQVIQQCNQTLESISENLERTNAIFKKLLGGIR